MGSCSPAVKLTLPLGAAVYQAMIEKGSWVEALPTSPSSSDSKSVPSIPSPGQASMPSAPYCS